MKEINLSDPQADILESCQQVNLLLSGQGGGKTHTAGVVSYDLVSRFPRMRGLIAANTYNQLTRSTLFRIREVWKEYAGLSEFNDKTGAGHYVIGRQPPKHFTRFYDFDSYNNIISFSWGAVVYIGSLDNYKSLDGMEISWAVLDETKDTKEEAVKEVIVGRLRQQGMYVNEKGELVDEETDKPFNPLYIFTSPAKVQWINEWFRLDEFMAEIKSSIYFPPAYFKKKIDNKLVTISATHLNLHNLPSNYIENQKANLNKSLQNMLIYGDPFSKAGGEFYNGFDREIHVSKYKHLYDSTAVLHLSFDQNVRPYITCTVHQVFGKKAVQIDEFCLESPNNRTRSLCKAIAKKYKSHQGGMYIYGDPSGKKEDTRLEQGENDYSLIFDELRSFRLSNKVESLAPAVSMRGQFINSIFENNYEGIEICIDESCRHTIADYLYLKEDMDGTKFKEKVKPSKDEPSYEKYGHCSDANDYFHCKIFKMQFQKFMRGPQSLPVVIPREYSSEHSY